jgi:GDPmannose 4,6-dehydratase
MKKVLITGILGQDGANMAEYLLENSHCEIYGMMRRSSNPNFKNCHSFKNNPRFRFVYGDLTDSVSIDTLVATIQPDYLINFGAQSFVGCSWDMPLQTFEVNATGVLRCLEAIRKNKPTCRFYSAGSSEEFGDVQTIPQDISHPLRPRSPYGASKAAARSIVKVYRESYGLYAVHGILFNHEGTKRGEEFVTRKITKGVARIKRSIEKGEPFLPIELGNLDAKRDWSDSEDFVDGVWKMLNQEVWRQDLQPELYRENSYSKNLIKPLKDYILSSDETHTIREFVELAFKAIEIHGIWHGYCENEEYSFTQESLEKNNSVSSVLVSINKKFYRPAEVDILIGDSRPAREDLRWKPKVSFNDLVNKMVNHDCFVDISP